MHISATDPVKVSLFAIFFIWFSTFGVENYNCTEMLNILVDKWGDRWDMHYEVDCTSSHFVILDIIYVREGDTQASS